MHQFLFLRRRLSLIVCMAMMLKLLTPALGQAMEVLTLDPLALEVCSAAGSKPQQVPIAGHAMQHCALCSLGASGAGAPPPAAGMLPAIVLLPRGAAVLAPARVAPQSWLSWSPAQARAPPP